MLAPLGQMVLVEMLAYKHCADIKLLCSTCEYGHLLFITKVPSVIESLRIEVPAYFNIIHLTDGQSPVS